MPRPVRRLTPRAVVLRSVLFGLAIVLGALAVWLISTTNSPRTMRLGVLAGFWSLLLGAFALVGSRRSWAAAETAGADGGDVAAAPAEQSGTALELRSAVALERAAQAEERRAFEAQLEARLETRLSDVLQREVRHTMGGELGALRSEIASLRSDLLEKVGGQIRLERIETTRVIGSDLEALQHEVRQLKAARDVQQAAAEPVDPGPALRDRPGTVRSANGGADGLTALPRLTPFTELDLDPDEPPEPSYRGRRRRADDAETASSEDVLARLLAREHAR